MSMKVLNFGKHNLNNGKRKVNLVTVKLMTKVSEKGETVVSITGTAWNATHTSVLCDNLCIDTLWNRCEALRENPLYKRIHDLCMRNGIYGDHWGTPRQQKAVDEYRESRGLIVSFDSIREYLKENGLEEDDGNFYGCGWNWRVLPENDLAIVKEIMETA